MSLSRRSVLGIASVELVANPPAATCGELLAWSALRFWSLQITEQVTPRMRALITAAVEATAPLGRLEVRLVLLTEALILEVVFRQGEPGDIDADLMPADARWSWHQDRHGQWCLRDELALQDPDHPTIPGRDQAIEE